MKYIKFLLLILFLQTNLRLNSADFKNFALGHYGRMSLSALISFGLTTYFYKDGLQKGINQKCIDVKNIREKQGVSSSRGVGYSVLSDDDLRNSTKSKIWKSVLLTSFAKSILPSLLPFLPVIINKLKKGIYVK